MAHTGSVPLYVRDPLGPDHRDRIFLSDNFKNELLGLLVTVIYRLRVKLKSHLDPIVSVPALTDTINPELIDMADGERICGTTRPDQ
ncbi:hypothetical protein [Pseudomonas sp. RIT-PI-o]|jgi:hypothetical protein|uniref:hypothetical protein n=1 Tax=Pseudomonas sp. RIT-PI-o TaxID=1690246 RepID=UPI00128EDB53|nr:hypothetical protein [Pseudomonas sp. RIT-PI-o]